MAATNELAAELIDLGTTGTEAGAATDSAAGAAAGGATAAGSGCPESADIAPQGLRCKCRRLSEHGYRNIRDIKVGTAMEPMIQ